MGNSIRVIAQVTAQAEKVEEVRGLLSSLVAPTRAEQGCISYQVCQSTNAPAQFVCIEEWARAADIDAHLAAPHVQEAFAKAQSLLAAAPLIQSYSPVA